MFFFNDTASTEIYTLSLHDALPISGGGVVVGALPHPRELLHHDRARDVTALVPAHAVGDHEDRRRGEGGVLVGLPDPADRSEEHTSELQLRQNFVCRLLLEKKNQYN